jgi:hypothetical protein
VCSEKVTSQIVESGKTTKEKVIESLFTGTRTKASPPAKAGTTGIAESREVFAVDGKPIRKTPKMPDLPFLPPGELTANSLSIVLGGGGAAYVYDFKVVGQENIGDIPVVRMEFLQKKPNVESLRFGGTAWIDVATMQAVRLEIEFLGFARSSVKDEYDAYSVLTNYAKADIGGELFWLPRSVRVEAKRTKNGNADAWVARYLAEYSGCRKFDVSVQIR